MDHDYYVPCFSRLVPQVLYGFQPVGTGIRLPDATSSDVLTNMVLLFQEFDMSL